MMNATDLHFDVSRIVDELLDEHAVVAEWRGCLLLGQSENSLFRICGELVISTANKVVRDQLLQNDRHVKVAFCITSFIGELVSFQPSHYSLQNTLFILACIHPWPPCQSRQSSFPFPLRLQKPWSWPDTQSPWPPSRTCPRPQSRHRSRESCLPAKSSYMIGKEIGLW